MKLAEQLEMDEKFEEAYSEYKKELPHKQDDIELLTKLAHLALILEKKEGIFLEQIPKEVKVVEYKIQRQYR